MTKQHWEDVYINKPADRLSWFQPHAQRSLKLIRETGVARDEAVIDIGGGASTLVDDLLREGYSEVSVLDLSAAALDLARRRLCAKAAAVHWIEADITDAALPQAAYAVWHDRAVFHFLSDAGRRRAYAAAARRALKPGGHLIISTFAEDGPERCSGLPVMRYSPEQLQAEFGSRFTLLGSEREEHHTPGGAAQRFVYCRFRRSDLV